MYPTPLTSVLTGATIRQLQHWRKQGSTGALLTPQFGSHPCLYSFQDVVALRMVVNLRQERSLQKIRRAVTHVLAATPGAHLSSQVLQSDKSGDRSIVWLTADGDYVDVVAHPGQGAIKVVMEQILGEFTTEQGVRVPPIFNPARGLTIDAERCSGYPTIEGTRIRYDQVASLAKSGLTGDDIRFWYPEVTDESVAGAVELADRVNLVLAA